MEHSFADVAKAPARTSPLEVVLETYADSTHAKVTQAMWLTKARRKAIKVGQDGIFWVNKVPATATNRATKFRPELGAEYWDLFTEYNEVDEDNV